MNDQEKNLNHQEETTENDVEFVKDTEFAAHEAHSSKDIVADLRAKLKKANEEKAEYLDGWQRTKADYVNSRKRDEEGLREAIKYAEANFIEELIPVLDSYDMAFGNKNAWENLPVEWRRGMEQIHNQLLSLLKDHDVEILEPLGKEFDPKFSEAVGVIDTKNSDEDDIVLAIFQKGYKLHDRIIRPAKVRVGKYVP